MSPAIETSWHPFRAGATLRETGSEAGIILRDEEHVEGARITLERAETPKLFRRPVVRYAITCGIYDWMVHTRFFASEVEAVDAYDTMKPALATILAKIPLLTDPEIEGKRGQVIDEIGDFTERFP